MVQILCITGSLIFLAFVLYMVIKGRLREEFSIIWLLCTFVLILFSFWRDGLDVIAQYLGIYYAPSLLFLGGIFAISIFLVHLSIVNSKQQNQIKNLAQELAILKALLVKEEEKK